MSDYEYTDNGGDTLSIAANIDQDGHVTVNAVQSGLGSAVYIPNADVPTVALELLKAAGQESVIVPKATHEVVVRGDGSMTCGNASTDQGVSPTQLREWAASYMAFAEAREAIAAREAAEKAEAEAAEKKLQERREELAAKAGYSTYMYAAQNVKTLIARVVDLEQAAAAQP